MFGLFLNFLDTALILPWAPPFMLPFQKINLYEKFENFSQEIFNAGTTLKTVRSNFMNS